MEDSQQDICRVCRSEGTQDRPLYHPCICTGSIKFIHQECLLQWLKYSKKEYCELCKHRFIFTPIYSPDMPKRLPIKDIVSGLLTSIATAVRYWLHYTLVAFAWLGIVPLMACRIYRCLFTGSVSSLLTLPLDMLSTDHLLTDCIQGCFIVMCTLCAFISLVWLREQILHGGAPEWLMPFDADGQDQNGNVAAAVNVAAQAGNGQAQAGDNVPAVAAQQNAAVVNNADDNQDDNNWNPIEWDRAGEELTWERLLGLDGSLVFLEHVFWVISLNTLFILVFAFCPYHIGHFTIVGFKLQEYLVVSSFEGLLTTLTGYLLIAFVLVLIHALASLTNVLKIKGIIGMCYIVVKVSLLVVIEIGMFPLMCGWWLDICSLPLFDASLDDRLTNFKAAPGTTMFVHWLVGMIYVFYFASFILLLREVLRPGVLWFLRNLNDPNFNPIQEMIHLPTHRHCRRIIASMVLFGSTVLVMLWLPVLFIKAVFTSFLPYHVSLPSDAPVSELSLELLLLQVILPALLEQSHTRQWMKKLVKLWCMGVSRMLNLRSYLLGDIPVTEENVINGNEPVQHIQPLPPIEGLQGLGAEHQAILQGGGPTGFQPYNRPNFFGVRVLVLILLLLATLFFCSTVCLIIPVWTGRQVMAIWMGDTSIHELYTAACGLYVCWIVLRSGGLLYSWLPRGADVIYNKLKEWFLLLFKSVIAAAVLIGLVPLLLGCLFEQVVVAPVRVPLNQTPIYFPWQDWALGVLHLKILCAMTMMGPNWWLKQVIEQVYNDGFRNMNLTYILRRLCLPVTVCLGLALAVPYVTAHSIVPLLGGSDELQHLVQRRIYPSCLLAILFTAIFIFQAKQFKKLYEHIKNDKYLVGQRLVNYERRAAAERRTAHETAS